MIYPTYERAEQVAADLNARKGFPPATVVCTDAGFTVVTAWRARSYPERIQVQSLRIVEVSR